MAHVTGPSRSVLPDFRSTAPVMTPTTQSSDQHNQGSWRASRIFRPFSTSALALLPKNPQGIRPRELRNDRIPETDAPEGEQPTVRDYHAINSVPPNVRVPKKIATPIMVEPKVWFANERTWISYVNVAVLLGTLALALFNASNDSTTRYFAYAYAFISVGVMAYGFAIYQLRVTMIRRRDPGHYDQVLGPVIICVLLFIAVLANFIVRVRETLAKQREDQT